VTTAAGAVRASAALRPPRTAAAVWGVAIAVAAGLGAAQLGSPTELLVVYELVLLITASGLLLPIASGRWGAAAASGLVVELGAAPAGAPVTARLAEVLRDPTLELRLRPPGGTWTDEAGRPAREPELRDGRRAVTRRVVEDGTEVALLHDPAALPDRSAAESAVAVAATAVDNARSDREVRARIEHLRRLRRGLLDAVDEERRQLEVELRAGPLRDAADVGHLLRGVTGQRADALREELAIVGSELDEIAQGLHPELLLEHGLAHALQDICGRSPVPVELRVDLGPAALPPAIALTAYYVGSEALTNIAKHSRAGLVRVELSARGGQLLLRITDDGAGGAESTGGGLNGLRDRVRAIDGELRVHSPPGVGTTIEARVPLPDGA
jgi:signal transduction histidine kinase